MKRARRAEKDRELSRTLSKDVDGNFERFIRAFQDRLYSFSLRLTNNEADAEEIVQEGLLRAYRALRAYEPQRIEAIDLSPWLYRIVLNVFRNQLRKARSRFSSLADGNPGSERAGKEIAAGPDPAELAERAEIREQLKKALASLPERYRVPLILRYVEDIGYPRMKDILKQPEGSIKSNVHRGIRLLRENFLKMNRREEQ